MTTGRLTAEREKMLTAMVQTFAEVVGPNAPALNVYDSQLLLSEIAALRAENEAKDAALQTLVGYIDCDPYGCHGCGAKAPADWDESTPMNLKHADNCLVVRARQALSPTPLTAYRNSVLDEAANRLEKISLTNGPVRKQIASAIEALKSTPKENSNV